MTNIIRKNSQRARILEKMKENSLLAYKPEYFMKDGEHFVGYEANTRMSDLKKLGLIEIFEVIKRPGKPPRYSYIITKKGEEYEIGTPIDPTIKRKTRKDILDNIEVLDKEEHQKRHNYTTGQTNKMGFIGWIKKALKF